MAERDNAKARIRKIDPLALAVLDLVDKKVRDLGGPYSLSVTLTQDMTREEQIMALIEKYLKEGSTLTETESKAKSTLAYLNSF